MAQFEIKDGIAIIPEGTKIIPNEAFRGCASLTNVVIPNSVTVIGDGAFNGCASLTNVVIPDSVTEIGWGAFNGCTSLIGIVVPSSITKIDSYLFSGCTSLTSIVIPDSVTKIGMSVFSECSSLTEIVVDDKNKKFDSRNNCNAIIETATNTLLFGCSKTIIPDSVTEIGKGAFNGCTSLISIVIPDSVKMIGLSAFKGCASLTSIFIPDSVTEIGGYAFKGCASLTSIVIPDSVMEIGKKVFCDCALLKSVVIPSSVSCIGESIFAGCISLENVVIEKGVKKIDSGVFSNCKNLKTITLSDGVNKIDKEAFDGCDNIERIYVPAKKIDYYKQRLPKDLHDKLVEFVGGVTLENLKNIKEKANTADEESLVTYKQDESVEEGDEEMMVDNLDIQREDCSWQVVLCADCGVAVSKYEVYDVEEKDVAQLLVMINDGNSDGLWDYVWDNESRRTVEVLDLWGDQKMEKVSYMVSDEDGKKVCSGKFQLLEDNVIENEDCRFIADKDCHFDYLLLRVDQVKRSTATISVPKKIQIEEMKFLDSSLTPFWLPWDRTGDTVTSIAEIKYRGKVYLADEFDDVGTCGDVHYALFKWNDDRKRYDLLGEI